VLKAVTVSLEFNERWRIGSAPVGFRPHTLTKTLCAAGDTVYIECFGETCRTGTSADVWRCQKCWKPFACKAIGKDRRTIPTGWHRARKLHPAIIAQRNHPSFEKRETSRNYGICNEAKKHDNRPSNSGLSGCRGVMGVSE